MQRDPPLVKFEDRLWSKAIHKGRLLQFQPEAQGPGLSGSSQAIATC